MRDICFPGSMSWTEWIQEERVFWLSAIAFAAEVCVGMMDRRMLIEARNRREGPTAFIGASGWWLYRHAPR